MAPDMAGSRPSHFFHGPYAPGSLVIYVPGCKPAEGLMRQRDAWFSAATSRNLYPNTTKMGLESMPIAWGLGLFQGSMLAYIIYVMKQYMFQSLFQSHVVFRV